MFRALAVAAVSLVASVAAADDRVHPWVIEVPPGWLTTEDSANNAEYHEPDEASQLHVGAMFEGAPESSPHRRISALVDLLRDQFVPKDKLISNEQRNVGETIELDLVVERVSDRKHIRAIGARVAGNRIEILSGVCTGDEAALGPCEKALRTLALPPESRSHTSEPEQIVTADPAKPVSAGLRKLFGVAIVIVIGLLALFAYLRRRERP
jgi:hypothetical protein